MFPLPRSTAPALKAPLTTGETWSLSKQSPEFMTMIVFYRGLHCPVCKKYLESLQQNAEAFKERGVGFLAISTDPEERAKEAKKDWDIGDVPVAYGFDLNEAKNWGLLVSEAINEKETRYFVEPGLFLIKPDNTVFFGSVQSMPFARPALEEIVGAVDFVKKKGYPARGDYGGFR